MGEQVKELMDWARRRKVLAAVFVAFTLVVGILIGSIVSGRASATKGCGLSRTTATPQTAPDTTPTSHTYTGKVKRAVRAPGTIDTTHGPERTRRTAGQRA